jgi:hypothetical protein
MRRTCNSGLIYIRKGDDTLVLDFRDASNPLKTIGAALAPFFPPGIGAERPIILGVKAAVGQ